MRFLYIKYKEQKNSISNEASKIYETEKKNSKLSD